MIRPLTLHCADGELRARVWDFGGQHVLDAMYEFFLTARSLYLLVLEQRSDSEAFAKPSLQHPTSLAKATLERKCKRRCPVTTTLVQSDR